MTTTHRLPTGFAPLPRDAATEFWVVRHGESTWNVAGRYQGQTDVPLSPLGHLQAASLAGRLTAQTFDAVYTSDLARAYDTAQAVAQRLSGPPEVRIDAGLREIDVGELAGRDRATLEQDYPAYLAALRTDPWRTRRPGGESMADLAERAGATFRTLRERHPGGRVLVFTHGGVVRVAVGLALGGNLEHAWARLSVLNTSVTRFLLGPEGGQLLTFNDAAHLETLEAATEMDDIVGEGAP
ncbi:histidine phosphatase family protein [Deinococcus maricopensis]|uniref:Phosphoglycerate mutase n=1 Tax=Deinococcus maricopensis (strain DSM 21211 / LMG 22137 / NRRL B-23946 / LB-34) TaxID=709986 RepID=E8U7E6_DEIML|nr:histidine phosphatase family protein [Deinococcus maricopensis]ADV66985.1 Phosphoglycerate mutase [Deinococcus maricopensis DSM 21211]